MKKWFTSDHHFWHGNIVHLSSRKLNNERQFDTLEEMHEVLIKKWNERVKPKDIVYHLGDFSFRICAGLLKRILARLNGRIILILGNHDKNEARRYIEAGFYDVVQYKMMKLGDYKLLLQHYPRFPWPNAKAGRADIILHGHTHVKEQYSEAGMKTRWSVENKQDETHFEDAKIHVGVDAHDFYPVSDLRIIELCDKLIIKKEKEGR